MIDLIFVALFCYQLHRMARQRGLSPLPYILNYIAAFLLVVFLLAYTFISVFGKNALQTQDGIKAALYLEPVAVAFEIFLFLYFRRRIQKAVARNEDDFTPPTTPKNPAPPKKDLSYFR